MNSGLNCQESILVKENENCVVAALSAGVGSPKFSEMAAQTAAETVCRVLSGMEDPYSEVEYLDDLGASLIRSVTDAVQTRAGDAVSVREDLDCTIAFVYISKKHGYAMVARLGNGAICAIRSNVGRVFISDKESDGEGSIFTPDASKHMYITGFDLSKSDIAGFILASDGLEKELFNKGSTKVEKIAELYLNAVSITENPKEVIEGRLDQLQGARNTSFMDDMAVAVLSRVDRPVELAGDPTWLCTCGTRNSLQAAKCRTCGTKFDDLYAGIDFKKYGGKAAFFTQLNSRPDREKSIISTAAGQTARSRASEPDILQASSSQRRSSVPDSDSMRRSSSSSSSSRRSSDYGSGSSQRRSSSSGSSYSYSDYDTRRELDDRRRSRNDDAFYDQDRERTRERSSSRDRSRSKSSSRKNSRFNLENMNTMLLLCGAVCLVVGLIVGVVFGKVTSGGKGSGDSSAQIPEDQKVLQLSNGNLYWGEQTDGVPNGKGVMKEGGIYFVGTFQNGSREGEFAVISGTVITKETYENNTKVSTQPADSGDSSGDSSSGSSSSGNPGDSSGDSSGDTVDPTKMGTPAVLKADTNLRPGPGEEFKRIAKLNAGTAVYVSEETEERGGYVWVKVWLEDGTEGWLVQKNLE